MAATDAQTYREQALLDQRFAAEASLPNIRAIHEAAAAKWNEMADRAERVNKRAR